MPKFAFKLEGVLRHRTHVEQRRQRDLALALAGVARLEGELADLSATAQTSLTDLRQNHLVGRIDIAYLTGHRRYMLDVQRKTHAIAQKLTLARQQADEARRHLAEAAKQRKMLEKLREQRRQQWSEDQARREFAELDDIGMRLAFADLDGATGHGPGGADPRPHDDDRAEPAGRAHREDVT